ncbi:hypothetical protein JCM5296_001190 [Sporobolomyces johnsonii]
MRVDQLLNDPLPPIRPLSFYEPGKGTAPVRGRLPGISALTSCADSPPSSNGLFAPPPLYAPKSSSSFSSHVERPREAPPLSQETILSSTSQEELQQALQAMRDVAQSFNRPDQLNHSSGTAVTAAYNGFEPSRRNQLWENWIAFSSLCRTFSVPVFPLQPDKIALLLAVHVHLPASDVLRDLAGIRDSKKPDRIARIMQAMQIAAKATQHLWPDVRCFVRDADQFELTKIVANAAEGEYSIGTPPQLQKLGFAPPRGQQPPPSAALSSCAISRPSLSKIPPPVPYLPSTSSTPSAVPQWRPLGRSLQDLCAELPNILHDLHNLPDDPQLFDVAQMRFQHASSHPSYAPRMASLHKAAVLYTHITAIFSFPTYPITSLKLAIFGLAFTPGPLGQVLDQAAPELTRQREYPRMKGTELDRLLKDAMVVRTITRGGDDTIPEEEKTDWLEWWSGVTEDWKSTYASRPSVAPRPSQPGPPRKRLKKSPSPTNSDVAKASAATVTSRPRLGGKQPKVPSERGTPVPSPSSSPEATLKSSSTTVSSKRRGARPRSSTPGFAPPKPTRAAPAPRWKPKIKGELPSERHPPPLPRIMDSPYYVVKSSRAASSESDDEAQATKGRSIALHRPKRTGPLHMLPVDVEALWSGGSDGGR